MNVTRNILPVLAGAVSGMIFIFAGEVLIAGLYPSAGTSVINGEIVSDQPTAAYALLVINYAVASFLAGIISSVVSRRITNLPALVVGIVLSVGGIYNAMKMPQPVWVSVLSVMMFLPFAFMGYLAVRKKTAADM